jgi:RimJ/RimL family protein N-acetyltransferase
MRRIVVGQPVVEWVAKRTSEFGNFGASVGIGMEDEAGLIAGVVFADWNGPNIVAHIASDGSKRWMTKHYLWMIFDYPFNQVKATRITCLIGEGNKESRNLCEHFGFTLETTLESAHPSGDLLVYRMWKKDCPWFSLYSKKRYALAA